MKNRDRFHKKFASCNNFFAELHMNKLLYNNFAAYEYSKKRKTCKSAGFNVFFYSAKNFNTSCCLVYIYLKLRRSVAEVSCAKKGLPRK